MTKKLNRRDFLRLAGLATLGTVGACATPQANSVPTLSNPDVITEPDTQGTRAMTATEQPSASPPPSGQRKRVLRIAHMTDFHVQPEGVAPNETIRVLRLVQAQTDPPDFILNTGDSVMDSLEADKARTEAQWDAYLDIMEAECKLPVIHAIGNHDVWGWAVSNPAITNDPLYGKEMAIEKLGLTGRHYSFDRAGWHFVVLDSTHLKNEVSAYPYIGKLDEEQFQWLTEDIKGVPQTTPICIASHIPILAACEYFDGQNEESGNWVVPAAWMHIDARQFRELFLQHPNIRLCLSGHTHQYEVLDYLGVQYMTNGAICGNWWNGIYMDFPPAYVMVNLYDDGTAESLFVPYEEA